MAWRPGGSFYDGRSTLDRFEALAAGGTLNLSEDGGDAGCFFAGGEGGGNFADATFDQVVEVEAVPANTTITAVGKAGSGAELFSWGDARTLKFLELCCIPKESTEPFPSTEETNGEQAVHWKTWGEWKKYQWTDNKRRYGSLYLAWKAIDPSIAINPKHSEVEGKGSNEILKIIGKKFETKVRACHRAGAVLTARHPARSPLSLTDVCNRFVLCSPCADCHDGPRDEGPGREQRWHSG